MLIHSSFFNFRFRRRVILGIKNIRDWMEMLDIYRIIFIRWASPKDTLMPCPKLKSHAKLRFNWPTIVTYRTNTKNRFVGHFILLISNPTSNSEDPTTIATFTDGRIHTQTQLGKIKRSICNIAGLGPRLQTFWANQTYNTHTQYCRV